MSKINVIDVTHLIGSYFFDKDAYEYQLAMHKTYVIPMKRTMPIKPYVLVWLEENIGPYQTSVYKSKKKHASKRIFRGIGWKIVTDFKKYELYINDAALAIQAKLTVF
jgi:hypothetical protein